MDLRAAVTDHRKQLLHRMTPKLVHTLSPAPHPTPDLHASSRIPRRPPCSVPYGYDPTDTGTGQPHPAHCTAISKPYHQRSGLRLRLLHFKGDIGWPMAQGTGHKSLYKATSAGPRHKAQISTYLGDRVITLVAAHCITTRSTLLFCLTAPCALHQ